jgi:hypothetical protein
VLARFAIDVPQVQLAGSKLEHPENNGERETARAQRAGIEDDQAAVATDEGNVGMATHHELSGFLPGQTRGIGSEFRTVYADVQEQDFEDGFSTFGAAAIADVNIEYVGQIRSAHVNVAADGEDGRDFAKLLENGEVADVSGVEDRVRAQSGDEPRPVRVRAAVRVSDDRKPQPPVRPKKKRGVLLHVARLGPC